MAVRVRRAMAYGVSWVCAVVLAGCGSAASAPQPQQQAAGFAVSTVATGLTIPWDLTFVGDLMLFDQRSGGLWSKRGDAEPKPVQVAMPTPYVNSEGGVLGLVADPDAGENGRFYVCQTYQEQGEGVDVRVLRYRLTSDTAAEADGPPVVTGLPLTTGRHTGCRLRFGPDGMLYVGTGDVAVGRNPQDLSSLGGKVLRVHPDGSIPADNPYAHREGNARYVWSYGHRNVQGLAFRPGSGQLWSAEHGTSRDDEVNLVERGANYGWDPVPGYDESTAMTDLDKFPDARPARWSSGNPTVATSGIAFLDGEAWGDDEGALAVAMLKGEGVRLLTLDESGQVTGETEIAELGEYGRIRTVQPGPDGALYFTTSNGAGDDVIGRLAPSP